MNETITLQLPENVAVPAHSSKPVVPHSSSAGYAVATPGELCSFARA